MVELALKIILRKRNEKNYSQLYVATKLKMSQSQYARIENGITTLNFDTLLSLIKVLEIDHDHFFYQLNPDRYTKNPSTRKGGISPTL